MPCRVLEFLAKITEDRLPAIVGSDDGLSNAILFRVVLTRMMITGRLQGPLEKESTGVVMGGRTLKGSDFRKSNSDSKRVPGSSFRPVETHLSSKNNQVTRLSNIEHNHAIISSYPNNDSLIASAPRT